MDNKLKWNHHVKATVVRANETLSLLRRTMYGCTRKSKIRAYEAIVKPVLMYGEPAWRPSTCKAEEQLERVQKRADDGSMPDGWYTKRDGIEHT